MKLFKRISLLVVILALGLLAPGAQPARARSSQPEVSTAGVTLSPGTYIGAFQFEARYIYHDLTIVKENSFTYKDDGNRDMDVSGNVKVIITGPQEGYLKATATRYDIYSIRDFSATGSGSVCTMTGYAGGDAKLDFPKANGNAYDSQTGSLMSLFSISNWSTKVYKNIVNSNEKACTTHVSKKILEDELQTFFKIISSKSPLRFYVYSSGESSMSGAVALPRLDMKGTVPGGWYQFTSSGSWRAAKIQDTPKGKEKWKR
jgi:hypothetical protein